jgi:hypothetical protein
MERYLRRVVLPAFALLVSVVATIAFNGCGSSYAGGGSSTQTVSILTQPASQTVPIGVAATFNVVASGSGGALDYQWMENGQPISGATAASYTTPDVTAEDAGEKFSVVVSEGADSATSTDAVLTVGPRSPKVGDLRFQLVDSPFVEDEGNSADILTTGLPAGYLMQYTNGTVGPLGLGGSAFPTVRRPAYGVCSSQHCLPARPVLTLLLIRGIMRASTLTFRTGSARYPRSRATQVP